jgi:hypothetical protein
MFVEFVPNYGQYWFLANTCPLACDCGHDLENIALPSRLPRVSKPKMPDFGGGVWGGQATNEASKVKARPHPQAQKLWSPWRGRFKNNCWEGAQAVDLKLAINTVYMCSTVCALHVLQ